jgi:hypothetical protein
MTPATAVPPTAIVRTADRRPSPNFLRNMMLVHELSRDTSRSSRRAQDAIARGKHDRLAAPPSSHGSPNWLKIAINSQR